MTSTTIHEVVEVCGEGASIDSGSRTPSSAGDDERRLTPGFYLVLKTSPNASRSQGEHIRWFGPFGDRTLAENLMASAAYLGIIASRPELAGVQPC